MRAPQTAHLVNMLVLPAVALMPRAPQASEITTTTVNFCRARRNAVSIAAAAAVTHSACPPVHAAVPGSSVDELRTTSRRDVEVPEFWPGRLQGALPPRPQVVLSDAPPIVILPGFGNDARDYVAPNALPAEVGLAAALARRGASSVAVVPIARSDWVNVGRGLSDMSFLRGDAQPEGPAFAWYIAKARATVERACAARTAEHGPDADPRVVLIGHSAGGWLARALCTTAGDEWALRHVRGIVTLGAPHASPPVDVVDQTRGTIPNVNRRAPGAYYAARGIFYVTVSSARVVGDENGDASAKNAFTSYSLVLGRSRGVEGDGFVPIASAFLDGATQLTLSCFHSGGSADPWPKDDWFGAESHVDEWLGPVSDRLREQRLG